MSTIVPKPVLQDYEVSDEQIPTTETVTSSQQLLKQKITDILVIL